MLTACPALSGKNIKKLQSFFFPVALPKLVPYWRTFTNDEAENKTRHGQDGKGEVGDSNASGLESQRKSDCTWMNSVSSTKCQTSGLATGTRGSWDQRKPISSQHKGSIEHGEQGKLILMCECVE